MFRSADSESASSATRRVFPACLDLHKWHWHELGAQGLSRVSAGRHLSSSQSKFADDLLGFRGCIGRLLASTFFEVQDDARSARRYVVAQRRCAHVPLLHREGLHWDTEGRCCYGNFRFVCYVFTCSCTIHLWSFILFMQERTIFSAKILAFIPRSANPTATFEHSPTVTCTKLHATTYSTCSIYSRNFMIALLTIWK